MSRVLVTGAAGFIGSHLVDRLLRDGHTVTALDNLSTGHWANLKPRAKLCRLEGDVRLSTDLRIERADWIFHLAALAAIVPSIEQPLAYHRANVDGTVAMLELARKLQVKRFVYAASSSCYGLPTIFPTPESAAISPQYPYALTKWIGEQYALHWMQVYKLPVVSCRLFNVYGSRQRTSAYGAVLGVFLAQKAQGAPLTVIGDGRQSRDFTHVSDVVDALVKAAESGVAGVFNVGSGETHTVNELADLIGGPRVSIPKRNGEPDCTFADIQKIQQALDWRPAVAFADGVRELLTHLDDWKQAPVWTPELIAAKTAAWHRCLA